ncbi:MAG: Smr/MutS family protein [Bacteroidales bacterium]|nr:Smr/MutS family protein [Bacteroidales bacterium]
MQALERKLGFDIVREMVRGKCATAGASRMTAEAAIMTAEADIVQSLRLTDEMRLVCMFEDTFPTDGFVDMREFLMPLTSELSCISLPNLVLLQKGLDAIRRTVAFFKSNGGVYPQLKKLSEPVMLYPEILRKIDSIINKHGEVRDNASPALAQIRTELKAKEKSISRTIAAILKKAQAEGITSEDAEVVVRDGKALIPVNASDKRKLQGIVCDESASGRTSFIEPIEVVNLNNAVRELQFEQQREIQRILMEFSDFLRPYLDDLLLNADFLVRIDFIRAKALVATDMIAGLPVLSTDGSLQLRRARHPLLERSLRKEGKEIVPLTLTLTSDRRIILISGPNAGGKSVCLKTVGLLQYMFQWGLLIPTSEVSEMLIFDNIFVDIGDGQSLENDLSTYSSHLQNLRRILEQATDRSLVLIDEFGSGTEPTAGGAIAEAVLDSLAQRGTYGVITTHYTNLKLYASNSANVANGAMQFDAEAIKPLFTLEQGLPGNSFAFELARKTGLPEDIIRSAEEKAGGDFVDMERQLRKIARNRRALDEKLSRVKNADRTLESLTDRYEKELSEIKALRSNILSEAKEQAREIVAGANRQIEQTIREIREAQAEKTRTKQARAKVTELQQSLAAEEPEHTEADDVIERKMQQILDRRERQQKRREERARRAGEETPKPAIKAAEKPEPLKVGDKVRIKESDMVGEIIQISTKKVSVAVGGLTTRTDIGKVERISAKEYKEAARATAPRKSTSGGVAVKGMESISERKMNFSPQVDVRGERLEAALSIVTRFIDDATMIGISQVKILHGKGTGVLREELRKYLRTVAGVVNVRDEALEMGGAGITVVDLA